MFAFAVDHPPPAAVILVAGDRDYAYALSTLRLRNYKVVLITPRAPNCLEACASFVVDWNVALTKTRVESNTDSVRRPYVDMEASLFDRLSREVSQFGDNSTVVSAPQEDIKPRRISPQELIRPLRGNDASITGEPKFAQGSSEGTDQCANGSDDSSVSASFASKMPTSPRRSFIPPPSLLRGRSASIPVESVSKLAMSSTTSALSETKTISSETIVSRDTTTKQTNREHIRRQFLPLIRQLVADRHKGILRPSRSDVAMALMQVDKNIYQHVGVTKFKHYATLAQRAGLVVLGGVEGDAWIALHPDWLDEAEKPEFHFDTGTGDDSRAVDENGTSSSRKVGAGCFQPLVDTLEQFHRSGVRTVLRSRVGQMLEPAAYRNAGVASFKEYVTRAVEVGIVLCGGVDGYAWIRLHPDIEMQANNM
ncbi:hypothetical protein EDD17DRAFT_1469751 [Pisolithus thermaeus]|nr:hypothetical protein EV401DRAFT_1868429 [Pisolithus croceorrhizus]KAI6167098.1 hypothetical protein EDD17DRAFT_1469751 [Pisolithus thermaeus]